MTTEQVAVAKALKEAFYKLEYRTTTFEQVSEEFNQDLQKLNLDIDSTEQIQNDFENLLYEIEKLNVDGD